MKKYSWLPALCLAIGLSGVQAQAEVQDVFETEGEQRHEIILRSADIRPAGALDIRLTYEEGSESWGYYKGGTLYFATDIHVSLSGPGLKNDDRVRAVLINRAINCTVQKPEMESFYQVDLRQMAGKYVGMFPERMPIFESAYFGTCLYEQEAAFVVNGQWLKDPINGTSNFKISFWKR